MGNIYDDKKFFDEYAKMDRSRKGLAGAGEWHQLREMIPDLEGCSVLDLGCGYGWHCRYAADKGAVRVLGIDSSRRMIDEAEALSAGMVYAAAGENSTGAFPLPENDKEISGIEYRVCGLEEYEYPEKTFDCVLSNLVLHYIADLKGIYRRVYRTLKEDGVFVFNIEHPTFTGSREETWVCDEDGRPLYWPVDDYFYPGVRETVFLGQRVRKQHHTLTQILNGLLECGFLIEAVQEAMPPEDMMELPGMRDEMRRPMMLMVRARKR